MKTIKLTSTKSAYLDIYVEVALSPFKLTNTEQMVVSRVLYYINEELALNVPLDAAIRLVSMYEYRMKIKDDITVYSKKEKKDVIMSEGSLNNALSSLKKKKLFDDGNRIKPQYVIKYSDGGFAYNINIKEDGEENISD